jgi:hypothetical protein
MSHSAMTTMPMPTPGSPAFNRCNVGADIPMRVAQFFEGGLGGGGHLLQRMGGFWHAYRCNQKTAFHMRDLQNSGFS